MTRFRVARVWHLIAMYRAYRRIRRDALGVGGLLVTKFFVENAHTCYTFSMWKDDAAILEFNTRVRSHPVFANSLMGRLWEPTSGRFGLWSAQFRLSAVGHSDVAAS